MLDPEREYQEYQRADQMRQELQTMIRHNSIAVDIMTVFNAFLKEDFIKEPYLSSRKDDLRRFLQLSELDYRMIMDNDDLLNKACLRLKDDPFFWHVLGGICGFCCLSHEKVKEILLENLNKH